MEILRCLCGCEAKLYQRRECYGHGEYPLVGWIECPVCGLRVSSRIIDGFYGSKTTIDDVINSWNEIISQYSNN